VVPRGPLQGVPNALFEEYGDCDSDYVFVNLFAQPYVRAAIEAGSTEHTPPSDVGHGIVTATVRTPQHTVVGFIDNPHFNTA
jgi:hypothetical protein